MATLARTTMVGLGASFVGATAGQSPAWQAAAGGGDQIPVSSGRGTLLGFRTTGTGSVVTLNSIVLSQYGTDQDLTITLAATDEKWVFIPADGTNRFDQGAGSAGLAAVTYTSVVGLTVAAVTIP